MLRNLKCELREEMNPCSLDAGDTGLEAGRSARAGIEIRSPQGQLQPVAPASQRMEGMQAWSMENILSG